MPYSAASVKLRRSLVSLFVVSAITLPTLLAEVSVFAASTSVNAAICGTGAGATLAITSPESDSVVSNPTISVSGDVTNATQIDVSIDGQYNSTVPLSAGQTSYQTSVQLSAGTHTISLIANDVCQMQDGTASVVVTYQAQTTPSTGQGTPTQVGENGGQGGVRLGEPLPTANNEDKSGLHIEDVPIIGPLAHLAQNLAIALDFEVKPQSGMLMQSVARFSFIVAGIAATAIGTVATAVWGIFFGPMTVPQRWMLRLGGVGLIVLAFLI